MLRSLHGGVLVQWLGSTGDITIDYIDWTSGILVGHAVIQWKVYISIFCDLGPACGISDGACRGTVRHIG